MTHIENTEKAQNCVYYNFYIISLTNEFKSK